MSEEAVAATEAESEALKRIHVGRFLAWGTLLGLVLTATIAGGYWCPGLMWGFLTALIGLGAAWPWRKQRLRAWSIGLGVTVLLAGSSAGIVRLTLPGRVFEKVFDAEPPAGVVLTRADQTFVLQDGAALVVIEDLSREELEPLLQSAGFARDTEAKERLASAEEPRPSLASFASGTDFLKDVAYAPDLEIYVRKEDITFAYCVLYFPEAGRAYAVWVEF